MSDHHSCCCLSSCASPFPCNTSSLFSVTCPSGANPLRGPARGVLCGCAAVLSARCWARAVSQGSCVHGAAGPARLCQAARASKAQNPAGFATEPCNRAGKAQATRSSSFLALFWWMWIFPRIYFCGRSRFCNSGSL